MHPPGFEPGTSAWKADMITTTPWKLGDRMIILDYKLNLKLLVAKFTPPFSHCSIRQLIKKRFGVQLIDNKVLKV